MLNGRSLKSSGTKTMSRKKYINAYEVVYEYDDKGRETRKMHYRGDYFDVSLDQTGLSKYRLNSFLLFFLILIIHITVGFLNNAGGHVLYVVLPYVAAFFPLLYWGFGVFRLPKKKQHYRLEVIGLSFDRVKLTSLLTAVFAGIAVLGTLVYLIFFRQSDYYLDLLFLTAELIVFCLALVARLQSQKIKIEKIDSTVELRP